MAVDQHRGQVVGLVAVADEEGAEARFRSEPALTVVLGNGCRAVERGSPLSHSAIVARELGLPAVVGVAIKASPLWS